jgi:hypothetical protein
VQPFDRHPARPELLRERAGRHGDQARMLIDVKSVTDAAFAPAVASWEGIAAAELRDAPEPVRDRAYLIASDLTWSEAAIRSWAAHVDTFNRRVDELRQELQRVPTQVEEFLATNFLIGLAWVDQETIRQQKRDELVGDLRRRWSEAYECHIEDGAREVARMLREGPSWEHLEAARQLGALTSSSPLTSFFAVAWASAAAATEALRLAGELSDPHQRVPQEQLREFSDLLDQFADDERFWYQFLTGLGQEGLLLLNGNLALQLSSSVTTTDEELALLIGQLQRQLGQGLALATTARGTGGSSGNNPYVPAEWELDA